MRTAIMVSFALFLVAPAAPAEPYWSQITLTTSAENAPRVIAAADALMSSEVGKTFPGRMLLQANVADGDDPATHTFVPIYRSAVEREAFVGKLLASAEWRKFQEAAIRDASPDWATFLKAAGQASEYLGATLATDVKSWGPLKMEALAAR